MATAAHLAHATLGSSWRVSRDGSPVAVVAVCDEGGVVEVAADLAHAGASTPGRHRFDTLQAAEAFVSDLIASFTYLGCDVVSS